MSKPAKPPAERAAKTPAAPSTATSGDVDAFLAKLQRMPVSKPPGSGGRLLFALDATASRQPTWDRAAQLQAEMFKAAAALGGLDIQLAFFRGYGEFRVSPWTADADDLLRRMTGVGCLAGETQIVKVLKHARNEAGRAKIDALVYVGDCFEEDIDAAGAIAGELGLLGLPCFMFHEGHDAVAGFAFQQIAKLTGGAYHRFDASAADMLRQLLTAVAVFASGGLRALEAHAGTAGGEVRLLTDQLSAKRGR
jgi:hypothetical protein